MPITKPPLHGFDYRAVTVTGFGICFLLDLNNKEILIVVPPLMYDDVGVNILLAAVSSQPIR
jgi:hypothetical protein